MLFLGVCGDDRPASFPIKDCTNPCGGNYVCFKCSSGTYRARCFLPSAIFPNMMCCSSYSSHSTTCDASLNPHCCNSSHLSKTVVALIVVGVLILTLALAFLAWWLVRRYRRSQNDDNPYEPTPTAYAEQYSANYKKRSFSPNPDGSSVASTHYGSYQSY